MSISRSASSFAALPLSGIVSSPPANGSEIEMVGSSGAMRRLRVQVRRIGPHFRTVLVRGEAGTGKALVARALHTMSHGADEPFLVCHAMEVEKTASRRTKVLQRGTLFFYGINTMNLEAQKQLLRTLAEMEQRSEQRIIASTSEDLKILVSTGRFRQDLYQRLATVEISLPPLRERIEDLPALAKHLLDRFAVLRGRCIREIADDAMERMQRYHWPGNVRELETVLRHCTLHADSEMLEPHHLSMLERSEPMSMASAESVRLQDVVEHHVLRVLKHCGGNKLRTAELLGISRSTLYRMLESSSQVDALR
jgi:DNA-binding NtrC family response regulator